MGRKWTEEEKQAASEKAKQRWAGQNKNPEPTQNDPFADPMDTVFAAEAAGDLNPEPTEQQDPIAGPQPEQIKPIQPQDYGDIQKLVNEMFQEQFGKLLGGLMQQPQQQTQPGLQVGAQGQIVGVREKYILDPKRYPDPCERLANEPRLRRFAFKENYELNFEVSVSQYQTKDGVNTREPKFMLELHRVMFDDETGERTNQRYTICRSIFHEDPEAALVIARDNGIEVDDSNEEKFLNEMRYLRMRDWLFEAFYPKPATPVKKKKEMVIGNRVVEVFEISSENSEKIPFDQIQNHKLKA